MDFINIKNIYSNVTYISLNLGAVILNLFKVYLFEYLILCGFADRAHQI